MKKLTPKAKFIKEANPQSVAALARDSMQMASTHDPEHQAALVRLNDLLFAEVKLQDRRFSDVCSRLSIIERQLERMGAPQYRTIRKAKIKDR